MGNIVIFGGSFNPVHLGHKKLLKYLLKNPEIKKVLVVPAACSPFKKKEELASNEHRFNMCKLAFGNLNGVEISDVEFSLPLPSFTINTVLELKKRYPYDNFGLLMGADAIMSFEKWKDYEKLLKITTIYSAVREDFKYKDIKEKAEFLKSKGGNIKLMDMPKIDISSSEIRNLLRNGKSTAGLLEKSVEKYISDNRLYRE